MHNQAIKQGRKRTAFGMQESLTALVFILPAFVLIIFFAVIPLINGLYLSLTDWGGVGKPVFVGLKNFETLFADPEFYNSMAVTLKYVVGNVTGVMIIGFLLALALHMEVKGWRFFQVAFFMNCVIPSTVVGILWSNLLHPVVGPITVLIKMMGITPPLWLGDYRYTIWVICFISIWQYSGYTMLFIFTAMQGIPQELYEASEIDGIRFYQKVHYIIIPMTKPVLTILFLLQTINSFKVFDMIYTLTKGGPGYSTEAIGLFLYNQGFWFKRFGYGSSIAVVMLVCVMLLSIFYIRSLGINRTDDTD